MPSLGPNPALALNDNEPDVPAARVNGVYEGLLAVDGGEPTELRVFALNSQIKALDAQGRVYSGFIETNENGTFGLGLTRHQTIGKPDLTLALTGHYREGFVIEGQAHPKAQGTAKLHLTYQDHVASDSVRMDDLKGSWRVRTLPDQPMTTLRGDGDLQDIGGGCQVRGRVSIPDGHANLLHTILSLDNCGGMNGSYHGIGIRHTNGHDQAALIVLVANDNQAYYLNLQAD